jgi:hypothetical protein
MEHPGGQTQRQRQKPRTSEVESEEQDPLEPMEHPGGQTYKPGLGRDKS